MNRLATRDSSDSLALFRELADRYTQYAAEEGVRVRPYRDFHLPHYSKLSPDEQLAAIEFLSGALEVFDEMKEEGLSLKDSSQHLWRSLRRIKMIPEADIFGRLTDEYTVEIYSSTHRHLFWNLRFLENFSLTLEQLLSQPWWELASRPPEILNTFIEITTKILSGETPGTIAIQVPIHIIEEINSEELLQIQVDVKYISPLKKNGEIVGGITVALAQIVGSRI